MKTHPNDNDLDSLLRRELGSAPPPDFDAWCDAHQDAVHHFHLDVTPTERRTRNLPAYVLRSLAASLLLLVGTVWLFSGAPETSAFADTIPAIDDVQSITWTRTFWERVTSADGQRTWLKPERVEKAYLHPGKYRETRVDSEGNPRFVIITDVRAQRELWLDLQEQTAVLKNPVNWLGDLRGPFAWVGDALRDRMVAGARRVKSIQLLGEKSIAGQPASVVRAMIDQGADQGYQSNDFLFDSTSKQLVAIYSPGTDVFDPDTAADRDNPPEADWSLGVIPGAVEHDIVVGEKLDAALFRLDPPEGFRYETLARPTVTEEEMSEYLVAAARFNTGEFPDSPYGLGVDQDRFNAVSLKASDAQTEAERDLIQLHDKLLRRELHQLAVLQFVEDHTVTGSFHYIGTGVSYGQADRIVCWYRLKDEKNPQVYRAMYGDGSVKDIAEQDLPLVAAFTGPGDNVR